MTKHKDTRDIPCFPRQNIYLTVILFENFVCLSLRGFLPTFSFFLSSLLPRQHWHHCLLISDSLFAPLSSLTFSYFSLYVSPTLPGSFHHLKPWLTALCGCGHHHLCSSFHQMTKQLYMDHLTTHSGGKYCMGRYCLPSKTIEKVVLAGFYYKGLRFWINFQFKFFEQELFYFPSELAGKCIIRMNEIFEPEALPFRTCRMTTAGPQPMMFSLRKSTCPQMCNYVQLCWSLKDQISSQ